jgi:hypothetical protein
MPTCVYESDDISFPCIMDIVHDVREGNINTTLIRKVLKQLDAGLAKFDPEGDSISFSNGQGQDKRLDIICNELEAINANSLDRAENGTLSLGTGTTVTKFLKALLWELIG